MPDLIKAKVWLLGKCDLCGTPIDRIEREGTTVWHFHYAPTVAPEMPRPPAQEPVSSPETLGTGSGRGTGVSEAPGTAQAGEEWGVRRRDGRVLSFENRGDAEAFADGWRGGERIVVHRFIGAWEPAPSLPVPSTEEARDEH